MAATTGPRAIETRYAGYRFRSRLEARWAVFFDCLGVGWEYEAQGFETPAGPYLPDFRLHLTRSDYLFEVKPEVDCVGDDRWGYAADAAGVDLLIAKGIPRADDPLGSHHPTLRDGYMEIVYATVEDPYGEPVGAWDNYRAFCQCPRCGAIGVEFLGYGDRVCGHKGLERVANSDLPIFRAAYEAARAARFEHGGNGGGR